MSRRLAVLLPFVALGLLLAAAPPLHAQPAVPPTVRVRLMEQAEPRVVAVEATDGPLALYAGASEEPLVRLEAGEAAGLAVRGREVHVQLAEGGLFATSLRIEPLGSGGAANDGAANDGAGGGTWRLHVREGAAEAEAAQYAGALFVEPAGAAGETLQLINHAPLEDYVASVVASEYGLGDLEGAKAMAVVARTYALYSAGKFGAAYDHVDHTASQMYGGLSTVTPVAHRATEATRGEVLTYGGAPIEAVYFSASGGHTASNEHVWQASAALPYLRGKPDPYAGASPHADWRVAVDRSRLLRRLTRRHGFEVSGFVLGERSAGGRVRTIELLGAGGRRTEVSGNDFRLFVNQQLSGSGLRSTLFDAERTGGRYVFEGSGYGHGVGLSQYGAHAMAERGHGYREILQFYYAGTTLQHVDGTRPPAPVVAETEDDAPERRTTSTERRIGW